MQKKRFFSALVLFGLMGQVAWVVENMYFNVFIYNMFSASASDISLMVAASSIVATVTTIFIGALSDRIGKRRIFISLGYILWGISILSFALVREDVIGKLFPLASTAAIAITITVILDCVMTFFGSSANDASFNAWLTDSADPGERGRVEGINSIMPLLAILVVFGGFMSFDLSLASSWTSIFIIIGAVVIALGIAGFFIIEEPNVVREHNTSLIAETLYSFRVSTVKTNPVFYVAILAFAIFNISIQIFMPYLIIYYEVSLELENYVLIMAPAIIIAGGVTAIYGRYYDKAGFTRAVIPTVASLCVGYLILIFSRAVPLVFVGSLFMMIGYLSGMAIFGALLRDRTPPERAGAFQGIRIVGQVLIPGIIGPAIGSMLLSNADVIISSDGRESFIPNVNIFIGALGVAVIAFLGIYAVYLTEKRSNK